MGMKEAARIRLQRGRPHRRLPVLQENLLGPQQPPKYSHSHMGTLMSCTLLLSLPFSPSHTQA